MFDPIEDSIAALKKREMIILVDDHNPGSYLGYLYALSEHIRPQTINDMITKAKGLVCVAITKKRANMLDIPLMINGFDEPGKKAFTVSVDHQSTSTGISAFERAETIQALIRDGTLPEDFKRPGHIFPLLAKERGLLDKIGVAEAAVDLARMCDSTALSGTFCEVLDRDGSVASLMELKKKAEQDGMKIVSISHLLHYRKKMEPLIERIGNYSISTKYGILQAVMYASQLDGCEYLVFIEGKTNRLSPTPIYMYAGNLFSDMFVMNEKKGMGNLVGSLEELKKSGHGILIYKNIRSFTDNLVHQKQTATACKIWDEVLIEKILSDIQVSDGVVINHVS